MSTEQVNKIDQPLAALTKLRDAVTPHGIQITNVNSIYNKDILGGDDDEITLVVVLDVPVKKAAD